MSDQTTGPDASGDAPDYAAKYNGLQQAFQKRTNEFAVKEQGWAAKEAEYEAKLARLAELDAKEQAAIEEENARTQYEALAARFEEEPPTPESLGNKRSAPARPREESLADTKDRLARKAGLRNPREAWPF